VDMKKILLFLALVFIATCTMAQNFSYGTVSQQEMDMKKYDKDTSANAVVLNEFGKAEIAITSGDVIRMIYEYHVKIKIFNHKGFPHGTVEIHVRNSEDDNLIDEVNDITGTTTYKDDNGLTQVAELDPKKVYKTRDYKYQSTLKFAMPGLRDGCVIEYKYTVISPFFEHFHSWHFQSSIPKAYSEYEIHIPAFWNFNVALIGPLKLTKNQPEIERACFSSRGATCDCSKVVYGMKDIPAFIAEEYMTAPKNFLSAINFDLVERTNPYTGVKTKVTAEWKDVDYQLKSHEQFGTQFRKKDYVKEHMPPAIFNIADNTEKAKAIYKWVQAWFKWNDYVGIYSNDGIKKAIDAHSGGISDINITLINALNVAGINTEAVLLSTRDHGAINKLYPVIGDFDYVIARATIGDKSYFLDATDPLLPFGILPAKCLNDQGRVFSMDKPSYWVDLDTKQSRVSTYVLDLTLQDNGKLKGTLSHFSRGYDAYLKRKAIKKFNTVDEYVDNLDGRLHNIKILNSTVTNVDSLDAQINEQYDIEINTKNDPGSERISLNPYLFDKIVTNPFKLQERNYPVDMSMPSDERYIITIHIPANYEIENKPTDEELMLPGKTGRFLTHFENGTNTFTFSNEIQFSKSIYLSNEYPYLKELFNKIILAEKAEVVFKKRS
jgi:hypothetical protein